MHGLGMQSNSPEDNQDSSLFVKPEELDDALCQSAQKLCFHYTRDGLYYGYGEPSFREYLVLCGSQQQHFP